jgi:hypothetical protein
MLWNFELNPVLNSEDFDPSLHELLALTALPTQAGAGGGGKSII